MLANCSNTHTHTPPTYPHRNPNMCVRTSMNASGLSKLIHAETYYGLHDDLKLSWNNQP